MYYYYTNILNYDDSVYCNSTKAQETCPNDANSYLQYRGNDYKYLGKQVFGYYNNIHFMFVLYLFFCIVTGGN